MGRGRRVLAVDRRAVREAETKLLRRQKVTDEVAIIKLSLAKLGDALTVFRKSTRALPCELSKPF
jgi:hypothetical protein